MLRHSSKKSGQKQVYSDIHLLNQHVKSAKKQEKKCQVEHYCVVLLQLTCRKECFKMHLVWMKLPC